MLTIAHVGGGGVKYAKMHTHIINGRPLIISTIDNIFFILLRYSLGLCPISGFGYMGSGIHQWVIPYLGYDL